MNCVNGQVQEQIMRLALSLCTESYLKTVELTIGGTIGSPRDFGVGPSWMALVKNPDCSAKSFPIMIEEKIKNYHKSCTHNVSAKTEPLKTKIVQVVFF